MTDSEKARVLDVLVRSAFYIILNMNDTFAYATADREEVDVDDLEPIFPAIVKHDYHALVAYVARVRGYEPLAPLDGHEYKAARAEVDELLRAAERDKGGESCE